MEALEAYNHAISIKPDYAEAYFNIGFTRQEQGKPTEALEAYNNAIIIKPDYAEVYNYIGNALKKQGRSEEAITAYKKALTIHPDYPNAKHMLSALIGDTPNSAPRGYVENLFDSYAAHFDSSLVEKLAYQTPRNLTDLILKKRPKGSLGSILDLGCGTGLIGLEIKRFCDNLEGIDLSIAMLDQAMLKNIYDKLTHSDIVDYLSNAELDFDYFVSADVFVYVGNLYEIFRLIKLRNKRSGKLIFSTEHTEKDGFFLEKSGRYSHSKNYIESLCEEFRYSISDFSIINLRKESDIFLTGGLYLLDF